MLLAVQLIKLFKHSFLMIEESLNFLSLSFSKLRVTKPELEVIDVTFIATHLVR